ELANYLTENISDFYLGVSLQQLEEELLSFYQETTLPLVALGNVQYLMKEDALPSSVLKVLGSEMKLGEEEQAGINHFLANDQGDYALHSPEQISKEFKRVGLEKVARETV